MPIQINENERIIARLKARWDREKEEARTHPRYEYGVRPTRHRRNLHILPKLSTQNMFNCKEISKVSGESDIFAFAFECIVSGI